MSISRFGAISFPTLPRMDTGDVVKHGWMRKLSGAGQVCCCHGSAAWRLMCCGRRVLLFSTFFHHFFLHHHLFVHAVYSWVGRPNYSLTAHALFCKHYIASSTGHMSIYIIIVYFV